MRNLVEIAFDRAERKCSLYSVNRQYGQSKEI